jgi:hypothetical protein
MAMSLCASAQSMLALKYPAGSPVRIVSGMAYSMGLTGTALPDEHLLMFANPGNLGSIEKTIFSTLVSVDFLTLSEGPTSSTFPVFRPRHIGIGLPFGIAGTIGLGFDRRSDATAKYRSSRPEPYQTIDSTITALSRNGGVTVWSAGYGHSIGKWAQLGLAYQRLYFNSDVTQLTTVKGGDPAMLDRFYTTDIRDSARISAGCNGLKAGVMVPFEKFTFGIAGEYLFGSQSSAATTTYSGTDTTYGTKTENSDFRLPPTVSGGISWQVLPELLVSSDVATTLWTYYVKGAGMEPVPTVNYTTGFGIGAQYVPAPNLLAPKYWETMRYRAGFRYSQLPAAGNSEFSFSLGAGLPLQASGLLDLVLSYGRRTDSHIVNYAEDMFSISIGVNGGRKWSEGSIGNY